MVRLAASSASATKYRIKTRSRAGEDWEDDGNDTDLLNDISTSPDIEDHSSVMENLEEGEIQDHLDSGNLHAILVSQHEKNEWGSSPFSPSRLNSKKLLDPEVATTDVGVSVITVAPSATVITDFLNKSAPRSFDYSMAPSSNTMVDPCLIDNREQFEMVQPGQRCTHG